MSIPLLPPPMTRIVSLSPLTSGLGSTAGTVSRRVSSLSGLERSSEWNTGIGEFCSKGGMRGLPRYCTQIISSGLCPDKGVVRSSSLRQLVKHGQMTCSPLDRHASVSLPSLFPLLSASLRSHLCSSCTNELGADRLSKSGSQELSLVLDEVLVEVFEVTSVRPRWDGESDIVVRLSHTQTTKN